MDPTVEVTSEAIRTVDMAKIFKDNEASVNSLSFTDDSKFLLTSADDRKLSIYSVASGTREKTYTDTTFGASLVTATHHNYACLYTNGVGDDHVVQYYNWHREHAIWRLSEHSARINCLAISPANDVFLSTALDGKLVLSDLRQRRHAGVCSFSREGAGFAAFDPTGVAYGLAHPEESKCSIKLYDTRNVEIGPFKTKALDGVREIKGFEFSDDGNLAMVHVSDNQIRLLDSMTLNQKQAIGGFTSPPGRAPAAFSACSKYVMASCTATKGVKIYETDSGREVHQLHHEAVVTSLAWSKDYFLVATASNWVVLWVPDMNRVSSK